mmetsp:Transcript_23553/g.34737  ORF Transcript_23553/g.34737 Transcript_23553/m.34737 type:complete len:135 (+) Transcript_23553:234-638(+)
MAEPEANIFELIYQISQDGQKQKKREDPAITEFLHLLKEQPDAAKQKTRSGTTPLHLALNLLKNQPEAAKQKDSNGWTPLHLACSKGSPFEVVAALLKAWPDAAKQKDSYGRTPLHVACRKRSNFPGWAKTEKT